MGLSRPEMTFVPERTVRSGSIPPAWLDDETTIRLEEPTFDIPPGTPHPEYSIPSEVIDAVVRRYGLADPDNVVIDLMAGSGNTLDRLRKLGVKAEGIELDPALCDIASSQGVTVWQGDCTKTVTPQINRGYHAAFWSPPFLLMEELASSSTPDYGLVYSLGRFVRDDGLVIIDSAVTAERDGRTLHPLADTIKYFTNTDGTGNYFGSVFSTMAIHKFEVPNPPPGCDSDFAILVLKKRFPARDALGALTTYLQQPLLA